MANKKGIDISKYQGKIDFSKVKSDGVEFIIQRAGYGNSISQKDTTFDYNVQNALANGIDVGAYWFSYAISPADAIKEADVFLKILEPYKGKFTMPVCFDFEYDSIRYAQKQGINMTKKLITDIAVAFMNRIKNAGWCVANYTNLDFIRNKFDMSRLKSYDLWLADYTGAPNVPCCIQQTASDGRVNGISGNVDMDICYKDYVGSNDSSYKCDTTQDFIMLHGEDYTFKITSAISPTLTFGTGNVLAIDSVTHNGNNHYFKVKAIGGVNSGTGVFVNGVKQCVINLAPCDTTMPINIKRNNTYVVASRSKNVTTGNSSIIQTYNQKTSNGIYLTTLKAVGQVGQAAGVFVDNVKMFVATVV
jgi:GH25 family lysozyme M1 (1,4-beta-N-acetylmuramidase)